MKYFLFPLYPLFSVDVAGKGNLTTTHIWRTREDFELFIITKGCLELNQIKDFSVKEGEYFISEPNVAYGGTKNGVAKFNFVHFTPAYYDVYEDLSKNEIEEILKNKDAIILSQCGTIHDLDSVLINFASLEKYVTGGMKKSSQYLLNVILLDLLEKNEANNKGKVKKSFQDIMEYMIYNDSLKDVSTVKQMADFFGYNEKYLIRLIKKNTGKTPLRFITDCKIVRAKGYLAETDMKVEAIALTLNYDYHYFLKLFKAKTGLSPTQFRKNLIPDLKIK